MLQHLYTPPIQFECIYSSPDTRSHVNTCVNETATVDAAFNGLQSPPSKENAAQSKVLSQLPSPTFNASSPDLHVSPLQSMHWSGGDVVSQSPPSREKVVQLKMRSHCPSPTHRVSSPDLHSVPKQSTQGSGAAVVPTQSPPSEENVVQSKIESHHPSPTHKASRPEAHASPLQSVQGSAASVVTVVGHTQSPLYVARYTHKGKDRQMQ